MQNRGLGQPAADPSLATGGAEDDVSVGQVSGFDIVPRTVSDLTQAVSVDADFVQVVAVGAGFPVREQDPVGVVVDPRITDGSLRILHQHIQFASAEIDLAEAAAVVAVQPG